MRIITYEAVQDEGKKDFDDSLGGAFIKFYLYQYDRISAEKFAVKKMKEFGWNPIGHPEMLEIQENDYDEDSTEYENIQQAMLDGDLIEIHTWPKECLE